VQTLSREVATLFALFEGPASGSEISARAGRTPAALGPGTLHPLLRRLERARLVRSWVEAHRSRVGRPRRFHELTAEGIATLEGHRSALRGLTAPDIAVVRPAVLRRLRANLRRAFAVSTFAGKLRQGMSR
jgi:DNA-binding PadR family transcriptional regulator